MCILGQVGEVWGDFKFFLPPQREDSWMDSRSVMEPVSEHMAALVLK